MEMDSSFMLKQFVAIDELKPSYLSSSLGKRLRVYTIVAFSFIRTFAP